MMQLRFRIDVCCHGVTWCHMYGGPLHFRLSWSTPISGGRYIGTYMSLSEALKVAQETLARITSYHSQVEEYELSIHKGIIYRGWEKWVQ